MVLSKVLNYTGEEAQIIYLNNSIGKWAYS